MRRRLPPAVFATALVAGCSLAVDLDRVSNGSTPLGDATPDDPVTRDASSPADPDGGDATVSPDAGALLARITFEDGQLVGGPSGATEIVGHVELETTAPLDGTRSARVQTIPADGLSYLAVSFPKTAALGLRLLLRVDAFPNGSLRIVRWVTNGDTTLAELELRPSGELDFSGSRVPITLGKTYDLEVTVAPGDRMNAAIAPSGQAPATFATATAPSAAADGVRIGQTVAASYGMSITVDDIMLTAR